MIALSREVTMMLHLKRRIMHEMDTPINKSNIEHLKHSIEHSVSLPYPAYVAIRTAFEQSGRLSHNQDI